MKYSGHPKLMIIFTILEFVQFYSIHSKIFRKLKFVKKWTIIP